MVVLMALGCPDEVLLDDYLLTNEYRSYSLALLCEHFSSFIALGQEYQDMVTMMAGVLPQAGDAVLAAIDERYPTREAYLKSEYGFDAARLSSLRAKYVV